MKQNWLAMCFFFFCSLFYYEVQVTELVWGECLQTAVSMFPWGKRNNNKKKPKAENILIVAVCAPQTKSL